MDYLKKAYRSKSLKEHNWLVYIERMKKMPKLCFFYLKVGLFVLISINFCGIPFIAKQGVGIMSKSEKIYYYKEFQYSREEVINLLYSNYKVPNEFYYENTTGWIYYIESKDEINGSGDFFSTDNFTEAQIVIEQYLQNNPYHLKNIVNFSETEKYFEFINEEMQGYYKNNTVYVPFRIHKKSYIHFYDTIYFER